MSIAYHIDIAACRLTPVTAESFYAVVIAGGWIASRLSAH